jgi:2-keto-4-pentenoate hydratase/2-oxohepta-3-ene-1,7-dioic acid hydratase in catechol pathway
MNWCRYQAGEQVVYGIIDGDTVRAATASPFDGGVATGEPQPLTNVRLRLPCIPPTFYAAGANYRAHLAWAAENLGGSGKAPLRADIGYRANNSIVAHGENIVIPRDSSAVVQVEGELAAVIGKTVKHLTRENALDCVLGYTIGNDVSERTWQSGDRTLWRAKNTDTFNPMGPWITPGLDPEALEVTTRINGVESSRYKTKDMIFSLVDFLVETTKYVTLYAGDVMWMGCDGATPVIKAGDVVEIEIPEIGVLRNPVVGE